MLSTRPRHLACLLAVALALPASAAAQTTPTEPLGDYTQTTPAQTETTPLGDYTQTTPTETETTPAESDEGGTLQEDAGGGGDGSAPGAGPGGSGAAGPPAQGDGSQPGVLAYTGFEALAVGVLGLALMGVAVVLQRRRRA